MKETSLSMTPALASSLLQFHHLGLAVRRSTEAILFLSLQGYQIGETILDPGQNVHLKMCVHPTEPAVEIIWPAETVGPIHNLTHRHAQGIVYHVCYQTRDLPAALAGLEKAGLKAICISPPKPAPLFDGHDVSFYNVIGIGLIEILRLPSI
jgi:methylmalonyl-CoA/ethylmalonyl-CoA epimerase